MPDSDVLDQMPANGLLLFRVGDFYEAYGSHARTVAGVVGLELQTLRRTDSLEPIPMAGFPVHARDRHLRTLLEGGYRVWLAEEGHGHG